MEPLAYLRDYFRTHRTAAEILSGAIACFAAVAVIAGFGVDPQATLPSLLYVVAIGVAFFLLIRFLDEPASRRAAGWFVFLLAAAWTAAFFWSRAHPRDLDFACAVYFWKPCEATADAVASEVADKPKLSPPTAGSLGADAKSRYAVFIQFAGYDRDTIIALASALSAQGWSVKGANRGGERIGSAAGLTEVRYRDPSGKAAADTLASALNASGISTRTVRAVPLAVIKPNTLEVWLGQ